MALPLTQLHPKVAAATVAGAVVVCGDWIITTTTHVTIPSSVSASLVLLATFGLGYLIPSDSAETPPVDNTPPLVVETNV